MSGNTAHLESFLEEAGCLPAKQVPKKSFVRVDSEESDFDVEEEFPSRRGAAKSTPGRGREGDSGDSTQSEDEHGDSKSGGKAKAGRKVSRRPLNVEQDDEYSTCDELNNLDDSDYYSCD